MLGVLSGFYLMFGVGLLFIVGYYGFFYFLFIIYRVILLNVVIEDDF